jgi:hypothetical protein
MKKIILLLASLFIIVSGYAQNIGIGTSSPTEKTGSNGNDKSRRSCSKPRVNQYECSKKRDAGDMLTFSKEPKG